MSDWNPAAEDDRLAALYELRILDTPNEPAFDRIVNLAQRVFDVPIVLVSLIDRDRQWFKARCGLGTEETPRSVSFCSWAIEVPDRPFVITDASKDERFANNPVVTGPPHVRFYAGAVVRAPSGHPVGTVCIIKPTPREVLTETETANLIDLAAVASDELRLREAHLQLTEKNAQLGRANKSLTEAMALHEAELRIGAESQRRILPPSPRRSPGMVAASLLIPSSVISGDTFGYGPLNDEHSYFWMADVSGHGVSAALLASSLSRLVTGDLLFSSTSGDISTPGEVMSGLHKRMTSEDDSDMYFTMIYGIRYRASGRVSLGLAGHPLPFVVLPDGDILEVKGSGTPIGLLETIDIEELELNLPPGSRLLVYSDGVVDASDPSDTPFGEDRLMDWLMSSTGSDSTSALADLETLLLSWTRERLRDDATAVLLDIR